MKSIALYIHIPFCVGKCIYCDFVSAVASDEVIERYTDAVCAELRGKAKYFENRVIKTLYVGGGTPTRMRSGELTKIIETVNKFYHVSIDEFTVEANPVTFDKAHAEEYMKIGVNRISLGVQSLNARVINTIKRMAKPEDAIKAVELAKSYFNNVSADVMLGLPYQTVPSLVDTLKELIKRDLTHISAYGLILSEKTALFNMVKSGAIKLPDEDQSVAMYDIASDILSANGYACYEISNFAIKGYECKHNLVYWYRGDYIGVGTAAHSLVGSVRSSNIEDTEKYISMLNAGRMPIAEEIRLTIADKKTESIMLALRCAEGLDIFAFDNEFDTDFVKEYASNLSKVGRYVEIKNNRLKILPDYYYVSNSIIAELI